MAEYPEQTRADHFKEARVFETLADAEQSTRLAELASFVAGGFTNTSIHPDLDRPMTVRSRNWRVGDVRYQGIYYPDTGECGIAWFRNGRRSYEQIKFGRFEGTDNMQVAWVGSPDVEAGYGLRITGSEWNTGDDELVYLTSASPANGEAVVSEISMPSDHLGAIVADQDAPTELRVQAAEIGHRHTATRLAELLPEFEQSRKRSKRVLGRLARRSVAR